MFRQFVRNRIDETLQILKEGREMDTKLDMLSYMLQFEMYRNDFEMMIDDTIGLMIAAFQSVSVLLTNCLYYSIRFKEQRQKLLKELEE
mmetsp:Transcript_26457/g.19836  ORF Transcript_26457/g.19836 Transcript_26457/m.19836 type:complete len:89 (-) Transcript_26457:608-874(-)